MNDLPYYIYLDSKIIGTAKQIATFFEDQIFPRENTTVLIKKYKHKSAKQIANIFRQHNIVCRFVSAADLDSLQQGIVFYPFNAQSNCRAVANRKLTHIFITHGESNKAASVKPIIRIYDYVFTAGQAGIDRFLAHGIFSQHDVDNGRIIMAGDTFIGKTGLSQTGKKCIFYAPTWEGGIEQENYSSLSEWQHIGQRILEKAKEYQVDMIVIRPHPNTGHRRKEYKKYVFELAQFFRQHKLETVIFAPNFTLKWWQRWQWKDVIFSGSLKAYQAVFAICDVSAIETQLINENIEYELFVNLEKQNAISDNSNIYHQSEKWQNHFCFYQLCEQSRYKKYIIDLNFPNTHKIISILRKLNHE